ncbi:MAG: hypothetical protein JW940_36600 [Polyangiaceae bacterium]|nr:hypothetical protein [Polyangiaceae bacterium]
MANKPSRKKRKLARERIERAKQHDLPSVLLAATPVRAQATASAPGGSGRNQRDRGPDEDQPTSADDSLAPASNAPRPNLWRRLPAGAKLGIFLVLAFVLAGVVIAAIRSRS